MDWLVASLVLSVVLTIVLNVGLRAFPRTGDALGRRIEDAMDRHHRVGDPTGRTGERRVRVWFPWKGMLIASIALTVLLNVVLRLG